MNEFRKGWKWKARPPEGKEPTATFLFIDVTIAQTFRAHFSADRVHHTDPTPASEDLGCFGTEWHAPSVFWFVGGTDAALYANAKAGPAD